MGQHLQAGCGGLSRASQSVAIRPASAELAADGSGLSGADFVAILLPEAYDYYHYVDICP
jgi:hypothetical protein